MIYEVFPAIDKLTRKLERGRDNTCLHGAVRLACWNALVVLNDYYSKTDESHVHRTALSESIHIFFDPQCFSMF